MPRAHPTGAATKESPLPPAHPGRDRTVRGQAARLVELVGVALFIGAALTILLATRQGLAGPAFLMMSAVSLCFAGGYAGAYRLLFDGLLRRSPSWRRSLLLNVAAVLTATALGGGLAIAFVSILTGPASMSVMLRILGVGLAVISAIRVLQLGYDGLRMQVREGELREERVRRQALMSELSALQARTDPHFLFNSLNTIAGLIEEDPKRAVAVVTRMGGFFRHNLLASRSGSVSLGDEIRAVSAYLEIQSLRFGERLRWTVELPPELDGVPVPPLALQPLVENAVVHGTINHAGVAHIEVRAASAGDRLALTVDDDGPGPGGSTHRGSGSSISDLAERINLLYDGAATLKTGPGPLGGFRARLDLPLSGFQWPKEPR